MHGIPVGRKGVIVVQLMPLDVTIIDNPHIVGVIVVLLTFH